jgi:hypothetical protein
MLDTDRIKHYVFPTDKLKEIRGASSVLDRLNRYEMRAIAERVDPEAEEIYANGGSGLFVINSDKTEELNQSIQKVYREYTASGASITCAVQKLPEHITGNIWEADVKDELELLRYRLREEKDRPNDLTSLPSHPFMRPCDSCGSQYAEGKDRTGVQRPEEQDALYCASCLEKRWEDKKVKDSIDEYLGNRTYAQSSRIRSPLWNKVINILRNIGYQIPEGTKRPNDFNDFRNFGGPKGYLGLIYADGNSMGGKSEELSKLRELRDFAKEVDEAVYSAVCDAIKDFLPVWEGLNQEDGKQEWMFPFDLLLLGGDDVVMVTPASVAMDVAKTIAKRFYEHTEGKHTLSVGVVLAPIKYPFGMLEDLAESTLRYAKTEGAKRPHASRYRDTFINFMTVTGSTSHDFKKVYTSLHHKLVQTNGNTSPGFYATLRPYTVEGMEMLLKMIREGKKKALGRTKLHQVREAVLKMNLTTSVGDARAILRNWRRTQQEFVYGSIYEMAAYYQSQHSNPEKPGSMFPQVTFPWFADGPDTYRTSLLDFVELYDFVAQEGVDSEA